MTYTEESKDWWLEARCVGMHELFFPPSPSVGRGDLTDRAKGVCFSCPVKKECLDHALENNIVFGVWGGTSERERRQIKRNRRKGEAK